MRTTYSAAAIGFALFLPLFSSATAPASAAGETCDGKPATIVAGPPDTFGHLVTGTPGDDVIVGTDEGNRIDGGGGNDTICALGGADEIIGGAGDDRLFGGLDATYEPDEPYWGDVIQPGPGDDYIDLGADLNSADIYYDAVHADKVSYADAAGPVVVDLVALTATGHGHDTLAPTPATKFTGVIGSPFADVLSGGPAHDEIDGGGGDDVITGGPGADDLDGDLATGLDHEGLPEPGNDVVSGGPGNDSVSGYLGEDVLRGEDGHDTLWGDPLWHLEGTQSHPATLVGGAGNDLLHVRLVPGAAARGGAGDDSLDVVLPRRHRGEPGRTIAGGAGRDDLYVDYYGSDSGYNLLIHVPRQVIRHTGKRETTLTGVEEFEVEGHPAPGLVTFRGGRNPEVFRLGSAQGIRVRAFGAGGADELIGGARADLLNGGRGRDHLDGGSARDRCLAGERLQRCERRR